MGVGVQCHVPAALPLGKTLYLLYRRLGGPQGWSGQVRKISTPTGIRTPYRPARSESLYRPSYPGIATVYERRREIWNEIAHVAMLVHNTTTLR